MIEKHLSARAIVKDANLYFSQNYGDRLFEIHIGDGGVLSLAIWLPKEKAEELGTNHQILRIVNLTDEDTFTKLWNFLMDEFPDSITYSKNHSGKQKCGGLNTAIQ